jgi:hypothetical protein
MQFLLQSLVTDARVKVLSKTVVELFVLVVFAAAVAANLEEIFD